MKEKKCGMQIERISSVNQRNNCFSLLARNELRVRYAKMIGCHCRRFISIHFNFEQNEIQIGNQGRLIISCARHRPLRLFLSASMLTIKY